MKRKRIISPRGTADVAKSRSTRDHTGIDLTELLSVWRKRNPGQLSLEDYRNLGHRANALGESLIAFDIAAEGLKNSDRDRELRQIKALALARMGSSEQAHEILSELRQEARDDPQTLALLAGAYKDLWFRSGDAKDLKQAYQEYSKAYSKSPENYWPGINAATLAFAMGDGTTASKLAARIHSRPRTGPRWLAFLA